MSESYEKLFAGFLDDEDSNRVARIARNVEDYMLSHDQAIRLDDLMCSVVKATAAGLGVAIDSLAGDPLMQGTAVMLFPGVAMRNIMELSAFIAQCATLTLMEGKAITPNPIAPDCDCNNCKLCRTISPLMLEVEKVLG